MIEAIEGAVVVEDVEDVVRYDGGGILILREPFKNRKQHLMFEQWYAQNHVVTAHFQGLIVIFFDPKLQKERYVIRN